MFARLSHFLEDIDKKQQRLLLGIAVGICLVFTWAGIFVSVHRFWQFETFYYDFGIYDQAIWRVAHFQKPVIDHFILGGKTIFADHFAPTIFLLSPLYWFTDRAEIILIAQVVAVGLSGLVLFFTARKITKSSLISLCVLLTYFLFVGLQNALITDFHELTIMTLPLMLTFYALATERKKLFWISFLLTLGCKESLAIFGLGLAWFIWWEYPEHRRRAILVGVISIIWSLVTMKLIIPYFSEGIYLYAPEFHGIRHFITTLYTPTLKVKTVGWIFASFAGLPLGSISVLPILGLNFISRFLTAGNGKWELGFHYNAEIAPTLAVGTALTLMRLQKYLDRLWVRIIAGGLVVVSLFLFRFILNGPFMLAINPAFAPHSQNFGFLEELLKNVPKGQTIMTHNNLAAKLTHEDVILMRDSYWNFCPEHIVMDARKEQNMNNFYGISNIEDILKKLRKDPAYTQIYGTVDQFIFSKKDGALCQPPAPETLIQATDSAQIKK